jgi:hypothetical protein
MRTIVNLHVCILLSFGILFSSVSAADKISTIEWNAQNKETAKRIHELTSRIYHSDLEPEKMIVDLGELAKLLAGSSFAEVPGMEEFQVVANAIYAWRTANVDLQKKEGSSRGESRETDMSGGIFILPPLVDIEAKYRSLINNIQSKSAEERLRIVSDPSKIEELREAWWQGYRLLLTSLANRGFSPPIDKNMIIGTWQWKRSDATFTFTFNKDGTMQAIIKPKKPEDWPGGGWVNEGKGTWDIDYNRLDVQMEKVWVGVFWKDNCVTWFDDTVKFVSKDAIVLDRDTDNEMKRVGVAKSGKKKQAK